MAERKRTPDLMGDVLGGKRTAKTAPLAGSTPVAEETEETISMSLRLPKTWRDALRVHFKSQGLDLSSGIRYALSQYMDAEELK